MADDPKPSLFGQIGSDIGSVFGYIFSFGGLHVPHAVEHLSTLSKFVAWVADWGFSRPLVLFPMYFVMLSVVLTMVPNFFTLAISWIILAFPIWAPVLGAVMFVRIWQWYTWSVFIATRNTVVLEVRIPREVPKSPRAMEAAFMAIWTSGGETTFIDRGYFGKMRAFFSFEIASIGGEVHFYIWCWRSMKDVLEAHIYAQYPEVEIVEVEDYASRFTFDPNEYDLFANDIVLDYEKAGVLPIRTYLDYELDKDPKEEFKVDPLAQVIEILSTLKGSEQAWIQIIVTSCKGSAERKFLQMCNEKVAEIRRTASLNPGKEDAPDDDERKYGFPRPTWVQNEQILAIQRHMGKRLFFTGIRLCYFAKLNEYRPEIRSNIRYCFLPFANQNTNWLKPTRWHGPFDYPWQDFQGIRFRMTTRRFLDAYRRRSWFYPPWRTPHYIMSAESLASIWHPPGATVKSPGLQRIPSTKSEPPPNLPM